MKLKGTKGSVHVNGEKVEIESWSAEYEPKEIRMAFGVNLMKGEEINTVEGVFIFISAVLNNLRDTENRHVSIEEKESQLYWKSIDALGDCYMYLGDLMKLKNVEISRMQARPNAELLGMVGAETAGWALALMELNRRGISVQLTEKQLKSGFINSPVSSKSAVRKHYHFGLLNRINRFMQKWGRFSKSLFLKEKKRAKPKGHERW